MTINFLMQIIVYMMFSFAFSCVFEKYFINIMKKKKVGQSERYNGPRSHLKKAGTPTMGGVIMLLVTAIFAIVYCIVNKNGQLAIKVVGGVSLASIGFGVVGFVDDYKKVVKKNTDGLNPSLKMFWLLVVSVGYIVFLQKVFDLGTAMQIPILKTFISLPLWFYAIFNIFVMLATTNAVNLTDGVDGLNGSTSFIMIVTLAIISIKFGNFPLAIILLVIAASVMGFLVYNFHPAKIFMGDTGSLFLGGVIATSAIILKTPLIIVLICIIPVVEALSDILQVLYVKKTGKRLFKMAPIHHHLELTGWRESRVVGVFSLITLLACIISIIIV